MDPNNGTYDNSVTDDDSAIVTDDDSATVTDDDSGGATIPKWKRSTTAIYSDDDFVGDARKAREQIRDHHRFYLWGGIFHLFFIILFPAITGAWCTCENGYPIFSIVILIIYLISMQFAELYVLSNMSEYWIWVQTRSKFLCKSCRIKYWKLIMLMDAVTAALSRADMFTDIGFLWVVFRCAGAKSALFIVSMTTMAFGVFCCQCCPTISWSLFAFLMLTDNDYGNGTSADKVTVIIRGADMIMTQKWGMASLLVPRQSIDDYDNRDGTGKGFGWDSNAMDMILSFNRFIFEDFSQTILQICFLFDQGKPLEDPVNIYVISSVGIALILSFIRTLTACTSKNRKLVWKFLKWYFVC